jgi:g-D-glutamyl-meso-diaminopimelate peptidase
LQQAFFREPPSYAAVTAALRELARENRRVRLFRAGRSALGREIPAIGIGNLKNAVLFVGGTHAQEWLTSSLLVRFAEEFAAAYASGGELAEISLSSVMAGRGLVIVPLLNPDGVEIALHGPVSAGKLRGLVEEIQKKHPNQRWQANARGVDLNHNFDAGWKKLRAMEIAAGITGPSPTRYGGPCPHSEPETLSLVHLTAAFDPRRLYSFHSQGEEIFWEYQDIPVPQGKLIAQTLSALSGYRLVQNGGLASHGGLKDWYIETFRRPGFTIEIGKGENPLPIEDLEPVYARLLPMMTAAAFL